MVSSEVIGFFRERVNGRLSGREEGGVIYRDNLYDEIRFKKGRKW